MGQKYTTQSTSGYASSSPPDDGSQVAANLITWSGVRTKLTDVLKTFGEAINTALVSALDLSARAISTPDTAVASDHWRTLQVTGTTTITLSSAASMGAGYEVGVFNAGVGVVTVTPGAASDTINGVSASVTVSIKGTKIFRTNQALTGYNIVGGYDPQTVTASTSVVTPLVGTDTTATLQFKVNGTARWNIDNAAGTLFPQADGTQSIGGASNRIASLFTPILDSGTTGSLSLKTNNGQTGFSLIHIGSAINSLSTFANASGSNPGLLVDASSEANTGFEYWAKGTGTHHFKTGMTTAFVGGVTQFQVLHTASTTRNITVTGSNGGNPTISTTAGSLAITPAVVMASSAVWGTGIANFGTITKRKTADESVTSSTTLQDDDHLTFAIAANEEWCVSYEITIGGSLSTTLFKVALTVPSGATFRCTGTVLGDGGQVAAATGTTSGSTILTAVTFGSGAGYLKMKAWILNGATPGNVTVQWAQGSSSGTALTFFKGSFLQATRVA